MQAAERAEQAVFWPWWPWPLTLTFKIIQGRDKRTFHVNLVQIHSVVPNIFRTQTKSHSTKNRTLRSSLHMVSWSTTVS